MRPVDAALIGNLARDPDRDLVAQLVPELAAQLPAAGIDTPLRVAHFLAQACVETWNFSRLAESLNYRAAAIAATFPRLAPRAQVLAHAPEALANAAYAYKGGNGCEASGDGWRFRGRGLLGLTGRANYAEIGRLLASAGFDVADDPDAISRPRGAVASAVAFWCTRAINDAADADDAVAVTRLVNGGINGLSDRLVLKHRALTLLKSE
jgi:putative chitinase